MCGSRHDGIVTACLLWAVLAMEASVLSQFLWLYCCTVSFSFSSISPGACIALVDKRKAKNKTKRPTKKKSCFGGMRERLHNSPPWRTLTHTHTQMFSCSRQHTHMDCLPYGETETGVGSGHNRKCSRDYIKRTGSLRRVNF